MIDLYSLIGTGYESAWFTNCHVRYRVFKGGRNTKKSYDILGYEPIMKILSCPLRNVAFIRATQKSHANSTFAVIQKLISSLGLDPYFKIDRSIYRITYLPTGQVMLFLGMDDPQKLQGLQAVHGYMTDIYVEEAFEIADYEGFRKLDGSIRGRLPDGLFHQITLALNAWSGSHWINDQFFKGRLDDDMQYLLNHDYEDYYAPELVIPGGFGKGLYLHTSTYKINEFRDKETYDPAMEELRKRSPSLYCVEALGMWGNSTESTYPDWSDRLIIPKHEALNMRFSNYAIGIDTGLSDGAGKPLKDGNRVRSATTMILAGVTADYGKLVAIDEWFWSNGSQMVKKTQPEIIKEISNKIIQWRNEYRPHPDLMKRMTYVYVDNADIGFRQNLDLSRRDFGIPNMTVMPSTKRPIQTRVDFEDQMMAYGDLLVTQSCPNLIREIKNSRRGEKGEAREDLDDHAINGFEYAWAPHRDTITRWKTFKQRG